MTVELKTNPSNIFELDECPNHRHRSHVGLIYLEEEGDLAHFSFLQDNDLIAGKIKAKVEELYKARIKRRDFTANKEEIYKSIVRRYVIGCQIHLEFQGHFKLYFSDDCNKPNQSNN